MRAIQGAITLRNTMNYKTIAKLTNRIRSLHAKSGRLLDEEHRLRATIRDSLDLGQYQDLTVYAVKQTVVRRHTRAGYKAVRVGGAK